VDWKDRLEVKYMRSSWPMFLLSMMILHEPL
jgi:hypothetical protein